MDQHHIQHIEKKLKRNILLNPGPATTSDTVKKALLVEDICPREEAFGNVIQDISKGLLQLGKAEEAYEVALFPASGTGAVEAALTSSVADNDRILIITNGAYGLRMAKIADRFQLPHEILFDFGEFPDPDRVEDKIGSGDFTHLAVVHHETSTGMLNPLEEILSICEHHGIKTIVDAMSSFGAYPLDLSDQKIDYLCASSNKCIHGMPGLSFVLFHHSCLDKLEQNRRGMYFDLYEQWNHARKNGQMRYTPPVQVCYAFRQAITETIAEGVQHRRERYVKNWTTLYDGLQGMGFRFYLKPEHQSRILLAVLLDGTIIDEFDAFHDYLYNRSVTVYPGVIPETNTFRVSVIGELTERDIQYSLDQIRAYIRE